jgi:hypothetical protein
MLLLYLVLAERFLFADLRVASPPVYLPIAALMAAAIYAIAFLFVPLPGLTTESLRWKRMLKFAKS